MSAQKGIQTRIIFWLLLGCIVSPPMAAQANDKIETLRVVQSAVSAAYFEKAKTWLSGKNGAEMEWWLRGNETKFASCIGDTFFQQLAEWQKDALWLSQGGLQGGLPSWYGEAIKEAEDHCIRQFVEANITRCTKNAGKITCKEP